MAASESGSSARGALWALLALPIALGVGWLVGGIPAPRQAPEPPATTPGMAVTAAPVRSSEPASVQSAPAPAPPSPSAPEGELSPWTSHENAVAESRRSGKPILIDFSAEWCGPCRRLKREVFDDGARGRAVQMAVIPVAVVDRAREDGRNPDWIETLQRQHGVDAFPTLVVYSPSSGRMEKARGYGGPQATVDWITQAAQSVR